MMITDLFNRKPIIDDSGTLLSDYKAIIDQGTFVQDSGSVTNSTRLLYTCPTGKVCYIVTVSMGWYNFGIATSVANNIKVKGGWAIRLSNSITPEDHGESSLSFPIPIRLEPGELVEITSASANCKVNGAFMGYELNK